LESWCSGGDTFSRFDYGSLLRVVWCRRKFVWKSGVFLRPLPWLPILAPRDCGASPCHALVCIRRARQPGSQPPRAQYIWAGLTRRLLSFVSDRSSSSNSSLSSLSLSLSLDRERASERRSSFFARKTISSRNLANNLVICFSKKETLSAKLSFH